MYVDHALVSHKCHHVPKNLEFMDRLEQLYDLDGGSGLPLPSELAALYGNLEFPSHFGRPYVISNFVSTLDGVVSLDAHGKTVGDVISGSNQQDHMVMGLLRAAADVVIIGAGTLRASPKHVWTPQHVFPPFGSIYKTLRVRMGKHPSPLIVIVTAHGNVDLSLPIFHIAEVPVLIVTTNTGVRQIKRIDPPELVQIVEANDTPSITAHEILKTITKASPSAETILIEGGPHLMGTFFAERCLDEMFLTLSPQVAGRQNSLERLGIVAEQIFTPDHPLWGRLVSLKRGGSHLFLRYAFASNGHVTSFTKEGLS